MTERNDGLAAWMLHPPVPRNLRRTQTTEIEREILRLVAEGKTNQQIADQKGWTKQSTKNRVAKLIRKFRCHDRRELAREAYGQEQF